MCLNVNRFLSLEDAKKIQLFQGKSLPACGVTRSLRFFSDAGANLVVSTTEATHCGDTLCSWCY